MELTSKNKMVIGLSFTNLNRKVFAARSITSYFTKSNQDSIHIVLQKHYSTHIVLQKHSDKQ